MFEVTKLEFTSTLFKKVRTKEIELTEANKILNLFERDCSKYIFLIIDSFITERSKLYLSKYGLSGLRTLDSILLCCAMFVKNDAHLFITSDKILETFLNRKDCELIFKK